MSGLVEFMNLQSLSIKTDLIFARYSGEVYDRGEYMVVKTPTRPNYFWGNFLIVPANCENANLASWRKLYDQEFDSAKQGFMTIALDGPCADVVHLDQFASEGFRINTSKVLTAKKVNSPPKLNSEAIVREIQTDDEWGQLIDVHYSDSWYLNPESQIPFLVEKFKDLRKMSNAKIGKRFGAFLDGKLVADLGIYQSGKLGRFNQVATHRSFRRLGLCGTLVFNSALYALDRMGIEELVMEADENYHAAGIYESVGFQQTQKQIGLEWFDPKIHG